MKLLVMADSHRNIERMLYAVTQTKPDIVVHLGDHIGDAMELQQRITDVTVHMVTGNADPQSLGQDELLLPVEGLKILLTHGHLYRVKTGLFHLMERAQEQSAELVLFGHTHGAVIKQAEGITFMNPGQMERHEERRRASCGIVNAADGRLDCEIVYLSEKMYDDFW